MRKIVLTLMVALSVAAVSSFANDTKPKAKKVVKCTMGGTCCKKSTNKADLMKAAAKPAKAVAVKKV